MRKSLTKFTDYVSKTVTMDKNCGVLDPKFRRDGKKSADAVVMWRDKFIEIFNEEKSAIHSLMLAQQSGVDIRNTENLVLPKQIREKIRDQFDKLIKEKNQALIERDKYRELSEKFKSIILDMQAQTQAAQVEAAKTVKPVRHQNKPLLDRRTWEPPAPVVVPPVVEPSFVEEVPYSDFSDQTDLTSSE
jgi:hypothetical protein